MISIHTQMASGYPVTGFVAQEAYGLPDLAEALTTKVYGAVVWAGNSRAERHFMCAYWCVLDFDEGVTKKEAHALFAPYRYMLGGTKSDGQAKTTLSGRTKEACDRFRVILPFECPIWDLDIYRYNMRRAIKRFGSDAQPYDGGRVWQPCRSIEYAAPHGLCLDVETAIPIEETTAYLKEQAQKNADAMVKFGKWPRRVLEFLDGNIHPAMRNSELFYVACTLFNFGLTVERVRQMVDDIPQMADHDKTESTIKSAARRCGAAYF